VNHDYWTVGDLVVEVFFLEIQGVTDFGVEYKSDM
jgi:hypothetical protein